MQRLRVEWSEQVKIEGCSLLGLRASTWSYRNPKAVSVDASPARLISSCALFLYMVQLIVPAAMWREGCPLACCRFCMAAPAFKKKNKKNKKSPSPKSIIHAAGPVSGISPFPFWKWQHLYSHWHGGLKRRRYITCFAPFNVLFLPFVVSTYLIALPYDNSSSMCTLTHACVKS